MRIKKIYQGELPENKILKVQSESSTDTYSCDYINNLGVGGGDALDELPIGSVIRYDGEDIPEGWEEVEEAEKIESGSNENGSWVKFSDGTMIVRHTFTQGRIPFTTAIVEGKIYQGDNAILCPNYPVEFIELPQVSLQPQNNMWGVILFPDNTTPATVTSAGTYRMIRVGTLNNGFNVTIDLIAIGKWK